MGAKASRETHKARRDFDEYDDICDHILVIDHEKEGKVVGAYRVLRRSQLPPGMKFYTQSEYDISKALRYFKGDIMELGRSCVDRAYRTRSHDAAYCGGRLVNMSRLHNVEAMFGCAILPRLPLPHPRHASRLSCTITI